jgi:hypothetical protein
VFVCFETESRYVAWAGLQLPSAGIIGMCYHVLNQLVLGSVVEL